MPSCTAPARAVALLLPLLAAAPSAADAPYAVPRLGEPALGSDGDHLLEGAATAPAFAWFARLHAAYAYGAALADEASRVTGEAALGLGLPAGFEIAAGLPAGATFAAREAADPGAGDAPDGGRPTERLYRGLGDAGAGLGDLRLGLLWSRPAPGRGGFRWLLGFEATLPTGDHERLLGEDGPTWRPLLGATFEAFGARIAGNLGYRFRPEHVSVTDGRRFEQDDEFLWGLGVRFVREHDIAWSLEATGAVGTATADGPWPRAESRPVLAGGGVDWPVTRLWRLGLFAAAGIAGEEPPRFTAHLRVFGRPHQLDEDLDGVPRCRDDCPLLPGPGHNRGCPIPDSDGDGFPDDEDACPAVPAQAFSDDGC